MSQATDERIAVTAAVATLLTVLSLSPLVAGHTWLFVAAITVITVMVSGIVARQLLRWWPSVVAVQAFVLVTTLLVLFTRSRIKVGPAAIGDLLDLFSAGMRVTRTQAPPVDATQGIVLIVAGSAGLVALLVDLMATSLHRPALAGLPLLAVYCVPAALLDHGLPWIYFVVGAVGYLILLAADAGERVRSWGRVLSSGSTRPQRGLSDTGLARGGRRVGIGVVVVAVIVPALVPGLSNTMFSGGGSGTGGSGKGRTITRINPILSLRGDLVSTDNTPLLTYRTTLKNPQPLRIVTSDVFDGNTWSPSTTPIPQRNEAQRGLPSPPGLTSAEVALTGVETHIKVLRLRETYLPMPYPATKVIAKGTWLYDEKTLNVIGDGQTTEGLSYQVNSLDVRPTAEQLATAATPPASVSALYTALPSNLPKLITETATQVAQAGTAYQQAVRLQRWFTSEGGFTYSTDAPTSKAGGGADAIVAFLQQKHGYCVHFASTMAVMARTLGIPARVAVGFLPGQRQADGSMLISAHDAHAWPELYFSGIGWVRFEPTPRSGFTTAPSWSIPPAGVLPEDPSVTATASASASAASSSAATTRAAKPVNEPAPSTAAGSNAPTVPWRPLVVALLLLVALALPSGAARFASRRRWSRAAGAAGLAEAAWGDLRMGLSDLGIRWAAAWTPRAVESRLGSEYALAADVTAAMRRLAEEIETARYAPPTDELGRPALERRADVAAVVSAVAALKSARTRWLARLWPPSGLASLGQVGPWVNSAAERADSAASALGSQVREKVGSRKG